MENKKKKIVLSGITVLALSSQVLFSGCAVTRNLLGIFFQEDANRMVFRSPATEAPANMAVEERYQLARHFQKKGRHILAVEELKKVIQINPYHAAAHNALGISHDRLRQFDLAGESYRAALNIDPDLDYVYNNIGYSYLLQGHLEQAAKAFEKAVALGSQKTLYRNNLALVHARQGKLDAAHVADAEPKKNDAREPPAPDISFLPEEEYKDVFAVQIGVYYDHTKAVKAMENALKKGITNAFITKIDREGSYKPYYRVRSGHYQTRDQAASVARKIGIKKANPAFVAIESVPITNTIN